MVAPVGSEQITPFTILMVQTGLSQEDVAASLGLPVDVVFSDYIASESQQAQITALVARSLTPLMQTLSNNQPDDLLNTATAMTTFATQTNSGDNTGVIIVLNDGELALQPISTRLQSMLTRELEWTFVNLNKLRFSRESFRLARFNDSTVSVYDESERRISQTEISYVIDGLLSEGDGSYRERFIYSSDKFMVSHGNDSTTDINVWLPGRSGGLDVNFIPDVLPAERFN